MGKQEYIKANKDWLLEKAKEDGVKAQTGCGQRGFNARVTGADNGNLTGSSKVVHSYPSLGEINSHLGHEMHRTQGPLV